MPFPGHSFNWKIDGDISCYTNLKLLTYIVYTDYVLRMIVGQCGLDVKDPMQACVFVDLDLYLVGLLGEVIKPLDLGLVC